MAVLSQIKATSDNVDYNIRDDYSIWNGRNILTQSKEEIVESTPAANIPYADIKRWDDVTTVNPNEIWTASFDAKSSTTGNKMYCLFYNDASGIVQVSSSLNSQGYVSSSGDGTSQFNLTTSYVRYWVTWTFNSAPAALKSFVACRVTGSSSSSTISIKNIKLEKSGKATDWSPAPEDIARFIGDETIELYG